MYIDIMGFTFSFYLGLSVFNLLYVVLIIIVIIMTIIIMFCLLRCQGRLTVCLAFVMPDASRQQRKTENGGGGGFKVLPVSFSREFVKRKKKKRSAPPRDMPALHSMLPSMVYANCE